MSMHFNPSSNPNQIGLVFQTDPIDHGQLVSHPQSNFGLNNVNGGAVINPQLVGTNPMISSNPTIGLHQNELIPLMNYPAPSSLVQFGTHGQLGLGPRVTEMIRTYVTPQRVQVHTIIDFFPVQNQAPAIPQPEVGFTDARTQLLSTNSTMERFFTPNDQIQIQGQPTFQAQSLPVTNVVNHSLVTDQPFHQFIQTPIHDPRYYQNPSSQNVNHYQNPSLVNLPCLVSRLQNQNCCNPSYYQNPPRTQVTLQLIEEDEPSHLDDKAKSEEVLAPEPLRAYFPKPNELQDPSDQNPPQKNTILQNPHLNESSSNPPLGASNSANTNVSNAAADASDEIEGDGRTHSLPCKKYGPYTCPKCKGVFKTSQFFAAHMVSAHYKTETKDERRKRLAAKYKGKKLRLVQSSGGLTVVPESFIAPRKRHAKRKNVHKKTKRAPRVEEEDKVEKQEQTPPEKQDDETPPDEKLDDETPPEKQDNQTPPEKQERPPLSDLLDEEGLIDVEVKLEPYFEPMA